MTDPRRPDHSIVDDDDVVGHHLDPAAVQPPRDDDVQGHGSARSEVGHDEPRGGAGDSKDDGEDDVEGHVYVRPEDQSRET
jgi:hypothetical protein